MKRALVTGGSKGIGKEIVKRLLTDGCFVYSLSRNVNEQNNAKNVKHISFDLINKSSILPLCDSLGKIDILVNAAGYMCAYPYDTYPTEDSHKMIAVNLEAPVELMTCLLPQMAKQNWGRVINLASLAGINGHPDIWYGITKAGLINVSKSFSEIYKGTGVTINSIAPGPVNTKMMSTVSEENKKYLRTKLLVTGNYMEPKLIANTVSWLASDDSSAINGTCIEINPAIVWK